MDLISKMKDGIVSSFDANVAQREEETKAMEGLRTMPGWNFCTFFILKVSFWSLVTVLRGVGGVDERSRRKGGRDRGSELDALTSRTDFGSSTLVGISRLLLRRHEPLRGRYDPV